MGPCCLLLYLIRHFQMHFLLGAFRVNHYLATIFVLKILSAFYIFCTYSSGLHTRFFKEANNMNPDKTVPLGAI